MSRAQHLSAFNGVTFGSSNIHCKDVDDPGPVVLHGMIRLVNGAIHDPNGTSDADTGPAEEIKAQFVIKASTAALFETAVGVLEGQRSKQGTLTGTDADGGTMTCTARLVGFPYKYKVENQQGFFLETTAIFKPKTEWS